MTEFDVLRLSPTEASLLRRLNRLFGNAFDDPDTFEGKPPADNYFTGLLAKEHIVVLVALSGENLMGGLVAYELDKFERARKEIYIYDLAVAEKYRRSGVATALIKHLGEIASQRGAWAIFVQADYGDDPAIALYESLGVRQEVLHFDIDVQAFPK